MISKRLRLAAALMLTAILGVSAPFSGTAQAQQGGTTSPRLVVPRNQNSGSEVLEIPANRQQESEIPKIPELAPQKGQELEIPSRQLVSQAGYAQVTVTVTDASGNYVPGLSKDDFRVFEDGQQRPVEFFRKDQRAPVSVGILVDTSGSMQPKIPQARAAIEQFVRDLNQDDDVFLFAFSDRPFLLQPFTVDHSLVMSRLELLHAYGRTALFDVILDGLRMVQRGRYDKKVLLVVTDGMDTASQASINQVVLQARSEGVLVYSIGIGDPNVASSGFVVSIGPFLLGGAGDMERVDAETLSTLSQETGAKTFIVRQAGDGVALRKATESISGELREQYTVGFVSPNPEHGGYRSLKVEVPSHPDVSVRVRKGLTVGESTTTASVDTN